MSADTIADPASRALSGFRAAFGHEPALRVRAPGRVNLLGEHVDYNDGLVLPAAIDRAVWVAASPRLGRVAELRSLDLDGAATLDLDAVVAGPEALDPKCPAWARYAAGVAWALAGAGLPVEGVEATIASDVPVGAGLSSSAALEVALAILWRELGGFDLEPMALARLCQRAENDYVGVKSGLMDQFACVHGRAGAALLLDCRSLAWRTVELPRNSAIVIADSRVRRRLGDSEYNRRRAECEEATRILAGKLPGVVALRDVTPADLDRRGEALPEPLRRRARHVVEEIARVAAVAAAPGAAALGAAMIASHRSLRDLYEVSCPELDALVEAALALPGCHGARLTGAGFGGCVVSLVTRAAAAEVIAGLARHYEKATGLRATIWLCQAADGAAVRADVS